MSDQTRIIRFNAPAIKWADIGSFAGNYQKNRLTRNLELGEEAYSSVIGRKGWLTPDLTFLDAWNLAEDNNQSEEEDPPEEEGLMDTAGGDFNNAERSDLFDAEGLFNENNQFGFRFMYNPPVINFSVQIATGVNPSFIFSGKEKANPLVGDGSGISLELTINRTEDMDLLGSPYMTNSQLQQIADKAYRSWGGLTRSVTSRVRSDSVGETKPVSTQFQEDREAKRVIVSQLVDIRRRGTMHDLNYLFRTLAARDWNTAYRGQTADIGIAYTVPMLLYLSDEMIYRVRLGSLNYTHRIFNKDMIPTVTDVAISFQRIPDVVGWANPPQNPGRAGETTPGASNAITSRWELDPVTTGSSTATQAWQAITENSGLGRNN